MTYFANKTLLGHNQPTHLHTVYGFKLTHRDEDTTT